VTPARSTSSWSVLIRGPTPSGRSSTWPPVQKTETASHVTSYKKRPCRKRQSPTSGNVAARQPQPHPLTVISRHTPTLRGDPSCPSHHVVWHVRSHGTDAGARSPHSERHCRSELPRPHPDRDCDHMPLCRQAEIPPVSVCLPGRRNEGPPHLVDHPGRSGDADAGPADQACRDRARRAPLRLHAARHADRPTAGRFGLAIARREHGHRRIIAMDYHARNYVRSD